MKSLTPGQKGDASDLELGLRVATEGVSMAITAILADPSSNHRFNEIERLSIIGRAIERQQARARKRVADFVAPDAIGHEEGRFREDAENLGGIRRRGRGDCGPNPFLGQNPVRVQDVHGDLEDLLDLDADDVVPGIRGVVNPGVGLGHLGAPHQNPAAMLSGFTQAIAATMAGKEKEVESRCRSDLARQIDSLTKSLDRTKDEPTRERLRRLLDSAVESLDALSSPTAPPTSTTTDGAAQEEDSLQPPGSPPASRVDQDEAQEARSDADEQGSQAAFVCAGPCCGNVHGDHWVAPNGLPYRCDICGCRMNKIDPPQPAASTAEQAASA